MRKMFDVEATVQCQCGKQLNIPAGRRVVQCDCDRHCGRKPTTIISLGKPQPPDVGTGEKGEDAGKPKRARRTSRGFVNRKPQSV